MKIFKYSVAVALCLLGAFFTAVNLYGTFQDLRPNLNLSAQDFRFGKRELNQLSYEEALEQAVKKEGESEREYSRRITKVIAQTLNHIHWDKTNAQMNHQLIPLWENYFLYFLGAFSGIPEFEKYHYTDYKHSFRRGIGICGDASMAMSDLLEDADIKHQILSYPGHVVVEVSFEDGGKQIFDPDFGVVLPSDSEGLKNNLEPVANSYFDSGYTEEDMKILRHSYSGKPSYWQGAKHFVTKKYYFERVSYGLKWPLPLVSFVLGAWLFHRLRKNKRID